jgi:hypothetical protein
MQPADVPVAFDPHALLLHFSSGAMLCVTAVVQSKSQHIVNVRYSPQLNTGRRLGPTHWLSLIRMSLLHSLCRHLALQLYILLHADLHAVPVSQ